MLRTVVANFHGVGRDYEKKSAMVLLERRKGLSKQRGIMRLALCFHFSLVRR